MTVLKVTVGYLYPDVMSTYGDRGNVEAIVARCRWRGIEAEVRELRLGDAVDGGLDLIVIGSGGEAQQRLVAADLARVKGPGICDAVVAGGAAALAVGGGYELLGRFCRPGSGPDLPGAGLFDAWTIRSRAVLGGEYGTITEARADRHIGELVVRWDGRLLAGFENHSGATYLGPAARPLGQVICGHGNSGSGHEGVLLGAAVGTHLRGPCLPRNPALADFLIGAALCRRHPGARLGPLPDELEHAARQAALRRARQEAPRRGSGLVTAAIGAAAVAGAILGAPPAGPARRRAATRPGAAGRSLLSYAVNSYAVNSQAARTRAGIGRGLLRQWAPRPGSRPGRP